MEVINILTSRFEDSNRKEMKDKAEQQGSPVHPGGKKWHSLFLALRNTRTSANRSDPQPVDVRVDPGLDPRLNLSRSVTSPSGPAERRRRRPDE